MNDNTEKRRGGNHLDNHQIMNLKKYAAKGKTASEIVKEAAILFEGISVNNIEEHLQIWSKYPDDSLEEHKKHHREKKTGTGKKAAKALESLDIQQFSEKLDKIIVLLQQQNQLLQQQNH